MSDNPEIPEGEPAGEQILSEYTDEDINRIVGGVDSCPLRTPHIEAIVFDVLGYPYVGQERAQPTLAPEIDKKIKELMDGKTLIDLGCGDMAMLFPEKDESTFPNAVQLAKHWGVGGYTAVDPYHIPEMKGEEDSQEMREYEKRCSKVYGINTRYVRSDMLHYVHSQPDNQNCYLLSGIDDEIIGGNSSEYKAYRRAMVKELFRTTARQGVVVSNASSPMLEPRLMEEVGFKPIETGESHLTFWVKD